MKASNLRLEHMKMNGEECMPGRRSKFKQRLGAEEIQNAYKENVIQ